MSAPEGRWWRWLERRLNLTEIFSFLTTFGLAYGDIDTRKPLPEAVDDAFRKPLPAYSNWPQVLGILAFVLFLFQGVTGVLLAFYYQPAPEVAYGSMLTIIQDTSLGWYIHQMHCWGSHILIGLLLLRMFRFVLHEVYKPPRELVWIFGGGMLLLAINAALTGALLPWDQRAYWSVTRSLELIAELPVLGAIFDFWGGGMKVESITLTRFYIFHVFVLPLLMFVFFYLHFAAVRRVGLSQPPGGREEGKPLFPDHLFDMLSMLLVLFGLILTLAVLAPGGFQGQADPFDSPPGIHPPWYLLPAYGLSELLPPGVGGGMVAASLLAFLLLPFVDRTPPRPLARRPVALLLLVALCLGAGLLGWAGYVMKG